MNHTTLRTIFAISMMATLMIVAVSIITSMQAQAILRLGRFAADTSRGATFQGPNDFCLSTFAQPPRATAESQEQSTDALMTANPCAVRTPAS